MFRLLVAFLVFFAVSTIHGFEREFSRDWVGVVFEPYTKNTTDKTSNSYTKEDVQSMIQLIWTKFSKISTYGMGTTSPSTTLENVNPSGWTSTIAATLNEEFHGKRYTFLTPLQVTIGTWTSHKSADTGRYGKEIENALEAAVESNEIFNETVEGIIISIPNSMSQINSGQEAAIVTGARKRLHQITNPSKFPEKLVKLGARLSFCKELCKSSKTAYSREYLYSLDFIICQSHFHQGYKKTLNVTEQAIKITKTWERLRTCLLSVNDKLEIRGETGWPSFYSGKDQTDLMLSYWDYIGSWASRKLFRVDMFTAFDEPWKESLGEHESHLGWWTRAQDNLQKNIININPKFNFKEKANPNEAPDLDNYTQVTHYESQERAREENSMESSSSPSNVPSKASYSQTTTPLNYFSSLYFFLLINLVL